MIRLARGLAKGLMAFCALGALSCAIAQSLGGLVFYLTVFFVVDVVRKELVTE